MGRAARDGTGLPSVCAIPRISTLTQHVIQTTVLANASICQGLVVCVKAQQRDSIKFTWVMHVTLFDRMGLSEQEGLQLPSRAATKS